ncbi:MAG: acyl--CoA ligase [bacterium]|nr:acyl--CoA ligase [bacterium]
MESIVESFNRWAVDRRDQEALWSRGEDLRVSFGQLHERVIAWARLLDSEAGRPVAVATGNCAAFCELFLALRSTAVPMVSMDAGLPYAEQLDLCRRLGIATLIHGGDAGDRLVDGVRITRLPTDADRITVPPPDTALIKLTSGSTGEPAGACFRDDSLAIGIRQIGQGMELSEGDRVLIAIPLSHSYGFDNGVLSLAVLGTPLVLEPGFFPAPLLRALAEGEITFFPLVPPLVRSLGQSPWPADLALRKVICAGGALVPEFAEQFRGASGRPIHNFYGSTETGGICFEDRPWKPEAVGTVGRPLPGVTVTLDEVGRVGVDSKANLIGYFGPDREASVRRFLTGDTAEWTPQGRLRLTGRTADILNIGGRKVPAVRVEEALRHLPGVGDAAVVGVEDAVRGERTVAFLVADRWPVNTSSVAARLTPREVRRIDSLPYTERGKLDRGRLRRLAREQAPKPPSAP